MVPGRWRLRSWGCPATFCKEMNLHRLAWHNAERDESELHDSLVLALLDSGETVMLQDRNRDYIFVANLPDVWKLPAESPPTDENLFGKDLSGRLAELKKDMGAAGSRGMLEVGAGNDRVFQFHVHSTLNQMNQMVMKTTIREVTAERRREQLLRSLLREVSHRSKNLLAIIQSLAGQTARFSLTKDDFLRKFRGRLGHVYSSCCASNSISMCLNIRTSSIWKARTCCSIRTARSISGSPFTNLLSTLSATAAISPITRQYPCNAGRRGSSI